MELLAGDAVIGNLSVRVNPDTALLETEVDDEGQEFLIIQRGHLDTAVTPSRASRPSSRR